MRKSETETRPEDVVEVRRMACETLELREHGEGEAPTLIGYGAIFDRETEIFPGFSEVIRRGAFAEALERDDTTALVEHAEPAILARRSAGTLKLREDAKGLFFEARIPDTTVGRDLRENVRNGNIRGASFGFRTGGPGGKTAETIRDDGSLLREVLSVSFLRDVSAVAFPAYDGAEIALRSLLAARPADARLELARVGLAHDLTGSPLAVYFRAQGIDLAELAGAPESNHGEAWRNLQRRRLELDELESQG